MPVAKKQQTKKGNLVSPRKHRWYKGVLVIIAGLALISVVLFYIIGGSMAGDKTGMEMYLRDRYGQEFEVTDLKDRAVTIGDPGQRVGRGHPVNDTSLTFEVGKSLNTGKYSDTYTAAVWEREGRPEAEAFLKTIYQTVPSFDLNAGISSLEDNPVKGNVPNLEDAIKKYSSKFIYGIDLRLNAPQSLSSEDKQKVISKLSQVAQFILSKHTAHSSLGITMWIGNTSRGYGCSLYDKDFDDINNKLEECFVREKTLKQARDGSN